MNTLQCISLIVLSTFLILFSLELINYFDGIKNSLKIKESFTNENCSPVCREVIKDYMSKRWGFDSKNDFIDCTNCPRVTHLTARDFDYSTFSNNDLTDKNNFSLKIVNLKKQITASLKEGKALGTILSEAYNDYYDKQGLTPQSNLVQNLNHWIIEHISSPSKLREYITKLHSLNESDGVVAALKMYINGYKNKDEIVQIWEDIYDELEYLQKQRSRRSRKSVESECDPSFETKFNNLTEKNRLDKIERERLRKLREHNTYNLMISDRKHREYNHSKRNVADEYLNK
jgi:hypothetical protein